MDFIDLDQLERELRAAGIVALERYTIPDRWWPQCGDMLLIDTEPEIRVYANGHATLVQRAKKPHRCATLALEIMKPYLAPASEAEQAA